MTKEDAKKAFELAEKELKEKQVESIKIIVKRTLEALEKAKKEKEQVEEKIKYLKMDIDDLKEGHLERIEERQKADKTAKQHSVVLVEHVENPKTIERVIEHHYHDQDYWYRPFRYYWNEVYCTDHYGGIVDAGFKGTFVMTSAVDPPISFITNSVAKDSVPGVYQIESKTINLR